MKTYVIEDDKKNVLHYCRNLKDAKESFWLLNKAGHVPERIIQLTGPYFGEGFHTREYKAHHVGMGVFIIKGRALK